MLKFFLFAMMTMLFSTNLCVCETPVFNEEMKYFTPLTQEEEKSIHYIITTLSTKSTISLFRYRKQLEKAGAKTENVHPLRFWKYVLDNESLKKGLPKIGSIPKKQLINDFAESFAVVYQKGELRKEYVDDFCDCTGVSKKSLYSYAKQGMWSNFVEHFFNLVTKG